MTKRKIENWQIDKYTAKLTFLWYDNFSEKRGMAWLQFQKSSFDKCLLPGLAIWLHRDISERNKPGYLNTDYPNETTHFTFFLFL